MNDLEKALFNVSNEPIAILDLSIPIHKYAVLDLSITNTELTSVDIADYKTCQSYIDLVLERAQASVAFGGYLEQRDIYKMHKSFTDTKVPHRNLHLGIDYWCAAGTKVVAPLAGKVHSFKNNNVIGDYGPTIILEHQVGTYPFYSLYGHLSLSSLDGLYVGKTFSSGEVLGYLGTPEVNVHYAPHLHFQIIDDIGGHKGDYPGVCAKTDIAYYSRNCPNPNLLLKLPDAYIVE